MTLGDLDGKYPELTVAQDRPIWMTANHYEELLGRPLWLDDQPLGHPRRRSCRPRQVGQTALHPNAGPGATFIQPQSAQIGRVTDAIIRGQAGEMLALASGCTVPRTDHSALGWLDGRDARRVPPNARPSLSLRASPTAGPGIGIGRSGTRHLSRTVARHDQEETRSCFVIRGLVGGNDYSGGRRNTVGETQLHFYTDWEKPPSSTEH